MKTKSRKNILRIGALAGIMAFMSHRQKDELYEPFESPHFKNVSEELVEGNLEFPSGLSSNYSSEKLGVKSTKSFDSDITFNGGIFVQGPRFYKDTINHGADITKGKNPIISQFSRSLDNLTVSPLVGFDLSEYSSDFDSFSYYALADSLYRSRGLTLDGLILKNGSILFSSNSSDRIFKIGLSGPEIYLEGEKLKRITDMIQGEDDCIYAVQAPLINDDNSSKVDVPKRVISIDDKLSINEEFVLPTDINSHPYPWIDNIPNAPNWWRTAPYIEKLKIIENSKLGKEKFGTEFYVSDLLEDVIYKVDAQRNVEVLAEGLRYPSSLAVDSNGNIFYTTSPLTLGGPSEDIDYPAALCVLNPETGQSTLLHEFGGKDISKYFGTGGAIYVKYKGQSGYVVPIGFNVTNILYESAYNLNFLLTNSHQGTLKIVSADKY